MIDAKVIAHSTSPAGIPILTMQLRYPKFIHGEFMTHRVFSRNASSSRAIPTAKLLEEVRSDELRAAPVFWGKNQPGMQAAEELTGLHLSGAKGAWAEAAGKAANLAEYMAYIGVHKQIVNRLLEPFSHINVIVTATHWRNFFGLRLHKDAQPEMRALAGAMWEAAKVSTPALLNSWDWHLPFIDDETIDLVTDEVDKDTTRMFSELRIKEILIKVSVARCARVSYLSFDTGKKSTIAEDLILYERLVGSQPMHASPAEHQATPDQLMDNSKWKRPQQHGNFKGWIQYRKTLIGEDCAPMPAELEAA